MLFMGQARSPFQDFECYLRIVVGLDDHDIQIILNINQSLSHTENHLVFIYSKIFYRLFAQWDIMKEPCKLNMMILA